MFGNVEAGRIFIGQGSDGNAWLRIELFQNLGCRNSTPLWRNSSIATAQRLGHDIRMRPGLGKYNIVGFITIVDVDRAKEFYRDTLGLRLVSEEPPYALVFEANGIMLRLGMAKERPAVPGTVLGWQVPDAAVAVTELEQAGVRFERYEFLKPDAQGIWTAPTGARVAWFKDPDGNILSISEHPEWKHSK
ncbi:MAG TPA: VOC family protein [Bryobacteraceae bacterium]|nr:VOC family protein [Bryobacteraceae bacterium]